MLVDQRAIGRHGRLGLIMTSYEPSVRCFEAPGEGPISEECYQILGIMPARKNRQIFGSAGAPGVTVGLPYDIYSGR